MKLLNLILERKQVGKLYHFTSIKNLKRIKECDCLIGKKYGNVKFSDQGSYFISTTRDKNLHKTFPVGVAVEVRITLDGDKLSDKYKIFPFNFFKDEGLAAFMSDEKEERINLGKKPSLQNLSNYILAIDEM